MSGDAKAREALHDFDFLQGVWKVAHRRLEKRHCGSGNWQEFASEAETRLLLGGLCNVEEHRSSNEHAGVALRTFDLSTGRWAIYWVSVREGRLQQPVLGGFQDGVGIFEGDDVDAGIPIRARYLWHRVHTGRPRWEQAFSTDGGQSWETNWIMDFERR